MKIIYVQVFFRHGFLTYSALHWLIDSYHHSMIKNTPPDSNDPIEALEQKGFDVQFISHAKSILYGEFHELLIELGDVLNKLELPITEIIGSGGGETKFTQRLRRTLAAKGWKKHNFEIGRTIDGVLRESTSHEVDHVKRKENVGAIACEIEWNNKDPFFDRDLENFKRLHAEGAISVGIIITRGLSLQDSMRDSVNRFAQDRNIQNYSDLEANGYTPTPKQKANVLKRINREKSPIPFQTAWTENFVANKYGQATTHWSKLKDRLDRGVGNPCPLLLIGMPKSIVTFDTAQVETLEDGEDMASMPTVAV